MKRTSLNCNVENSLKSPASKHEVEKKRQPWFLEQFVILAGYFYLGWCKTRGTVRWHWASTLWGEEFTPTPASTAMLILGGIPLSRGKWLYHLCHPLGSGADTANPLHMFNAAHAKPWSCASIPQVSPTDIPTAAAAAAGSVPAPGCTNPPQQPSRLGCISSTAPASPGTSERDVTALASKNGAPSSSLALPQPCQADHHLPGALQQDVRA